MNVRNNILNIVKKEPKATTEIIEKLKEIIGDDFIQEKESKFYQTYLKGLEEKGFLFKIYATEENKKMLKDIFHRKVWKRKKKEAGDFPKEFKTFYIYSEYPNSKILRESVNKFIKDFGDYIEYKEELLEETNRLIKLLSEFKFLANKQIKLTEKEKNKVYIELTNSLCSTMSKKELKEAIKKGLIKDQEKQKKKEQKRENYTSPELEEDLMNIMMNFISLMEIIDYTSTINPKKIDELKRQIDDSLMQLISFILWDGNSAVRKFLDVLKKHKEVKKISLRYEKIKRKEKTKS